MSLTKIYELIDPITNETRYIGKTKGSINKRFNSHIHDAINRSDRNAYVQCWIKNIVNNGSKPIINLIDEVPTEEWQFWEKYWIAQYKAWGVRLTNSTNGGDGTDGYTYSQEYKDNVSKRMMGNSFRLGIPHDKESLKKISNASKKTWQNEEFRKFQSNLARLRMKGVKKTEECKKKHSQTKKKLFDLGILEPWNKGKRGLQEAWNKGMPRTQETKDKISKILRDKKMTSHNAKGVVAININNEKDIIKYKSITKAAQDNSVSTWKIVHHIERGHSFNNYIYKYDN